MGDLNFNITKDVNLNKVVNLNINKNVDVNVDNKDLLATAEADAEAFGLNALAEVDAYTYVREFGEQEPPIEIFNPGQVQLQGNVVPFHDVDPGNDISIDFNQDMSPGVSEQLPDVDDVNGFDVLFPLHGEPAPPADTGLPQPLLTIDDLTLNSVANLPDVPDGDLWQYENPDPFTIDFGERHIDRNLNGMEEAGERGNLSLTVPAGDSWEVLFAMTDGLLINLAENNAVFNFVPNGGADIPSNNDPFEVPVSLHIVAESLGDIGTWDFNATAQFPWQIPGSGGNGEAFAYAESTAAIDLNGDGAL